MAQSTMPHLGAKNVLIDNLAQTPPRRQAALIKMDSPFLLKIRIGRRKNEALQSEKHPAA